MIEINRGIEPGRHKITDAFPTLRDDPMMLGIFGSMDAIDEVLSTVFLNIIEAPHYMYINRSDGSINSGLGHLRNSDDEVLYLDILHELYHVKQQREGADLFPKNIAYIDWPTEIEAYEYTVKVARHIGMTDSEIFNYLYVEFISDEDLIKLARRLNLRV